MESTVKGSEQAAHRMTICPEGRTLRMVGIDAAARMLAFAEDGFTERFGI